MIKSHSRDDVHKHGSGYSDNTAAEAIRNIRKEELAASDRYHNLMDHILYICELANFEIEGGIVLKDKTTGKIWR